jgi:glycosyltransferase involved in cell wall biosynthesis
VIVPNYNHAQFLPRCLGSLLSQTQRPDEIVVIDDASTDDSMEVLSGFAAQNSFIHVYRNESNRQVAATMNRGAELATGDYLAFTGADDEVSPHFLQQTTELLQAHPRAGFCCGLADWRCGTTGMEWRVGTKMPQEARYFSPDELTQLIRNQRFYVSFQSPVFRRNAFVGAGMWKPELKWCTDCFTTNVTAFRHGICFVPEVLSVLNLLPNSYYHSDARRRQTLTLFLQLLQSDEYADVLPPIAASGILGHFGWDMARLVLCQQRYWDFLNVPFLRAASRRVLEVAGRRLLPNWLARIGLRSFYGARPYPLPSLAGSAIRL